MRLLLLTHCFYPSQKRGGPTVSMTNMAKLAAEFMDVSVVTIGYDSDGTKYKGINEGKNSIFGCDVYYLQNNRMADFSEMIQNINPDVIYISSLFSWQYCVPCTQRRVDAFGIQHEAFPKKYIFELFEMPGIISQY